jgi:hypothetical protein
MRATILLAAILTCAALTGCDQAPQAVAPVAPQASVLPPAPPPPAIAPAPVQTVMHHRHHWRRMRYASESYSDSESETPYGYSSDSRSSDSDSETSSTSDTRRGGQLWIDGFGRAYHADAPARRSGTMTGKRLAAWGGYDVDCDK